MSVDLRIPNCEVPDEVRRTFTDLIQAFVPDTHLTDYNHGNISLNSALRHTAVTATDSTEIDFTLTGQDLTASIIAASIDETKLDASVNSSLDLADSAIQDISGKADKTNVLELDNTTAFTPNANHEPATKKYVDDSWSVSYRSVGIGSGALSKTNSNCSIAVGYKAGQQAYASGDGNANNSIFIGYKAGLFLYGQSNKIIIDSTGRLGEQLIYGDSYLQTLDVAGDLSANKDDAKIVLRDKIANRTVLERDTTENGFSIKNQTYTGSGLVSEIPEFPDPAPQITATATEEFGLIGYGYLPVLYPHSFFEILGSETDGAFQSDPTTFWGFDNWINPGTGGQWHSWGKLLLHGHWPATQDIRSIEFDLVARGNEPVKLTVTVVGDGDRIILLNKAPTAAGTSTYKLIITNPINFLDIEFLFESWTIGNLGVNGVKVTHIRLLGEQDLDSEYTVLDARPSEDTLDVGLNTFSNAGSATVVKGRVIELDTTADKATLAEQPTGAVDLAVATTKYVDDHSGSSSDGGGLTETVVFKNQTGSSVKLPHNASYAVDPTVIANGVLQALGDTFTMPASDIIDFGGNLSDDDVIVVLLTYNGVVVPGTVTRTFVFKSETGSTITLPHEAFAGIDPIVAVNGLMHALGDTFTMPTANTIDFGENLLEGYVVTVILTYVPPAVTTETFVFKNQTGSSLALAHAAVSEVDPIVARNGAIQALGDTFTMPTASSIDFGENLLIDDVVTILLTYI